MSSAHTHARPQLKALHAAVLTCLASTAAAQMVPPDGVAQLDTVVVTAAGFEQEIKDAPASISVITREQLESRPFHNLADAVADVEGVTVERGGKAGGMNISIRGLPSDYTLILVDGKRLNQNSAGVRANGFGDVDTNGIPPLSAIDRIEVVRGPMSTLYGSDAIGGVINIITRKVAREWLGQVTVDGTVQGDNRFGNSGGANFYISGPLKENLLGLSLRGSYYKRLAADGDYPATLAESESGDYTGNIVTHGYTASRQNSAGIRLALTPNADHDILLDVDGNWQNYDNRDGQLGTLNVPGVTGGGYDTVQKFNRTRYGLTHLGRYGSLTSDSSLVYETTETKGRLNPVNSPARPTDGAKRKLEYDNIVFDTKWNMPLFNDRHNLTFGGQWREQSFKDTLDTAPLDLDQYQWALFAENEWRIRDNLALTLGLRYDDNEQFGGHWSPRGYLVWNAAPMWTLKGGVSKGYKTPDVHIMSDDIVSLRGQGTMPVVGSSDLTPETSTSSELGLYFDNAQGTNANLTFFHTKFKDKIETENVPNCRANPVPGCLDLGDWQRRGVPVDNFFRYTNVDQATIKGLEFGGRLPIYAGVALRANYTLTRSEKTSGDAAGQPLGSQPRHALNLGLDWEINDQATAWLRGEYRAKQFAGVDAEDKHVFYDPYWLTSVGGSYRFTKNVTVSASIYNLFDKNFVNYGDRKATATSAWQNSYRQILEGRRLWVSTTITF